MTLRLDILKRNYELEAAKYVLAGRKVRENPLLDLAQEGGDGGGGFGMNQALQLGKQNLAKDA
jgi:hypothetical protein